MNWTGKDIWDKIFVVLPYVVLAFVLFIIFARRTEYREREKQYKESIEEYKKRVTVLDLKVISLENAISQYRDSVSVLEETKKLLEKRLQHIKQENEQIVAYIISSDTDWNIRFLSEYLSEENCL